ncbi:MAG: methyltransferase [Pseudomonadota bacterium]
MTEITDNAFLGGRLQVLQPAAGYRAGADPVFLASAVPARPGQSVLDVGCGVGTAMLCLAARVPGLHLTGVELQPDLAEIASKNFARNQVDGEIVAANLAELPSQVRGRRFDHVMTNPPFFDRATGSTSDSKTREIGRGAGMDLHTWLDLALRRVLPGGALTLIHRTEHLPACLAALGTRAGDVTVLPLVPRRSRPAKLFLLQAKKGGKGPFRLMPPLVLHEGDAHTEDGDSYTQAAREVLRDGKSFPLSHS